MALKLAMPVKFLQLYIHSTRLCSTNSKILIPYQAQTSKKLHKDKLFARVKATSSLMCCHVEKRSRSEMPRRDHLLSNASLLPCHDVQKPCKQRVKACKKKYCLKASTVG